MGDFADRGRLIRRCCSATASVARIGRIALASVAVRPVAPNRLSLLSQYHLRGHSVFDSFHCLISLVSVIRLPFSSLPPAAIAGTSLVTLVTKLCFFCFLSKAMPLKL